MRVYFAHSIEIYGTAGAARAKRVIKKLLPGFTVLDPETLKWDDLTRKYGREGAFRHVVLITQRVVVLEHGGGVGKGVYAEVRAALRLRRPVHALRGKALVEVKSVEQISTDWTLYGQLVLRK